MSYSRRDKEVMGRIVSFLRKEGVNVWVDNEKLIPGTPIWEEEIEKAIKAANVIIVVMSPDSKNSEWVRREISLADQYRKHILPVLVHGDDDSSITLRLVTRQFVDMRQDEEMGLKSLYSALTQYFQGEITQTVDQPAKIPSGQQSAEFPVQHGEKIHPQETHNDNESVTASIEWNMIFLAAIGWAVAGGIGGYLFNSFGDEIFGDIGGEFIAGLVGGFLGGIVMLLGLQNKKTTQHRNSTISLLIGWALGGAIGWTIGFELTEAIGAGIGMAIFGIIGLIGTFGFGYISTNWKRVIGVSAAWFIGEAIGWLIARRWMIDSLGIENGTSWAIGTAIGWAIGGMVLSWQVMNNQE